MSGGTGADVDSSQLMSADAMQRFSIPRGGRWFFRQDPMFELYREMGSKGFTVAWDKGDHRAAKFYGFYRSPEAFYEALQANHVDKRWGYEVIPRNTVCKGYMDIEWVDGVPDRDHRRLSACVASLRRHIQGELGHNPLIHVCCGTRPIGDGLIKHSYHVVLENVGFDRNDGAMIKRLLDMASHGEEDLWTYVPSGGDRSQKKSIVDMSVYSKHRVFRLPLCSKYGPVAKPLVYITQDPLADDLPTEGVVIDQTIYEFLTMVICLGAEQFDVVVHEDIRSEPPASVPKAPKRLKGAEVVSVSSKASTPSSVGGTPKTPIHKKGSVGAAKAASDANAFLFDKSLLQDLLVLCGDTNTVIDKHEYLTHEDTWRVQCRFKQTATTRVCLRNPQIQHAKNNYLLFVYPREGKFVVNYQCMARKCIDSAFCRKPELGVIQIDDGGRWKVVRTLRGAVPSSTPPPPPSAHGATSAGAPAMVVVGRGGTPRPPTTRGDDDPVEPDRRQPRGPRRGRRIVDDDDEDEAMPDTPRRPSGGPGGGDGPDGGDDDDDDEGDGDSGGPGGDSSDEDDSGHPDDIDPEDKEANTYRRVKKRFEKDCFKIKNPFCYCRVVDLATCELQLYNFVELKQFFNSLTFWGENLKSGSTEKMKFINAWLEDPRIREYDKIVVDPTDSSPGCFNMWPGLRAAKLDPVTPAEAADAFEPFAKHILEVVARGNRAHAEWIYDWCAWMIQRPDKRTQIVMCLFGKQGCGKNIWTDFFREQVVGSACSYQTANPEIEILGRFAIGLINHILVQIDEVGNLHEYADKLKNIITSPTINYEKKMKDVLTVKNISNICMTSNNENALRVAVDDRRTVLMHCDPKYVGNRAYFEELHRKLSRPFSARGIFQTLEARDLSAYGDNMQASRPITAYYKDMQNLSIPISGRFLSALYNSPPHVRQDRLSVNHAFEQCRNYATKHRFGFFKSSAVFGKNMLKYDGVTADRGADRFYKFDWPRLKACLDESNEYDPDADLGL